MIGALCHHSLMGLKMSSLQPNAYFSQRFSSSSQVYHKAISAIVDT